MVGDVVITAPSGSELRTRASAASTRPRAIRSPARTSPPTVQRGQGERLGPEILGDDHDRAVAWRERKSHEFDVVAAEQRAVTGHGERRTSSKPSMAASSTASDARVASTCTTARSSDSDRRSLDDAHELGADDGQRVRTGDEHHDVLDEVGRYVGRVDRGHLLTADEGAPRRGHVRITRSRVTGNDRDVVPRGVDHLDQPAIAPARARFHPASSQRDSRMTTSAMAVPGSSTSVVNTKDTSTITVEATARTRITGGPGLVPDPEVADRDEAEHEQRDHAADRGDRGQVEPDGEHDGDRRRDQQAGAGARPPNRRPITGGNWPIAAICSHSPDAG